MQNNGPFQPGQPGYGQPAEPGQNSQDPSQQPPQLPGRRVIEQPYGPPIIIEEPALPPTPPLAQTVRANSQPPGALPFTPLIPPVQSPPPPAPAQGYGVPYQAGRQPQPMQQGYQTQVPPQGYPQNPPQGYPTYRNAAGAPTNYPPAGYPPTGYAGGSFPPGGNPPQDGARRGGMPPSVPIAGGVAVVVVLIAIIIAATRGPGPSPVVHGTATPKGTNTPVLTGKMDLGSDWTQDSSGNITISGAKSTFSSSDTLAWVVNLDQDVGTLQAQVRCVTISTDGTQAVIYTETYDIGDATDVVLAEKYTPDFKDAKGNPESAATVTKNGASGKYRLEFVVNGTLRAAATFTYNT